MLASWPLQVAEIAQASDNPDLERRATLALASILPNSRHEFVWASDDGAAGPGEAAIMARLRAGMPVMGRIGLPGYIPMRCGAQLEGWVRVIPGRWSPDQEQALSLLAAVVGPTRRALRPDPDAAEAMRQQLRAAIAQARDTLDLDTLLDQLNQIVQRTIGPVFFLVALRYQQSSWISMEYLSNNGQRVARQDFWEQRAGLIGTILQTETPIFTDDYHGECARSGVTPLYVLNISQIHAWMGAPLHDGERAYGAISCYSDAPEEQFAPLQRELFLILAEEAARPIRNARLLRSAEQQARQMQALSRITRAITSTLDPQRVPSLIIEQAQELFNAEEGSLLILDQQTGELVFSYAGGPAGHQLLGQRLPLGVGVAGYVASTGLPAVVNNAHSDGRFYGTLDGSTGFLTRSLIAVPLRGIDGVKGVIEILNRRDDAPFTEEDSAMLEAIADHAMIALENASHFAQIDQTLTRRLHELDRSNDRLRRILRASNTLRVERNREDLLYAIVQSVSESAGFRSSVIALVQHGDSAEPYLQHMLAAGLAARSFERLRAARAPLGRLLTLLRPEFRRSPSTYMVDRRHREYIDLWGGPEHIYIPDMAHAQPGGWHPHDVMFSLLRNSRGELLGLIAVSDPEDGMLPGPEQVQILDIFANQAAVALENAQLYSDLQHSLSSLTALNGLGMALNTSLRSPQEIYELTVGGMVAQSEARWGMALLWRPLRSLDSLILGAQIGADPAEQMAVEQLAREAILLRRPQTMRPSAASGEAVVAIPLRATRNILGAICIGYAEGLPSASEIESLSLFAGQAAVAVESLQLFSAVRLGRDQLASIMASTREGMLLVDDAGCIAVANDAFHELVDLAAWPITAVDGNLDGASISELLARWQAQATYSPGDLEQLYVGLTRVADGQERFVRGQLNSPHPGQRALEWSVLRAIPEGESNQARARTSHRWPILLTVHDITAAKEAERLRQDLTNMMVHDLRSPLTSVITSIDMIFRGTAGEASQLQRDILSIAYASTQHLLDMVNLLLDISRLESGQMPLDCAPIELTSLADRAISRMTIIAHQHNVTIRHEAAAQNRHVVADRDIILRVLQNLLDNALKFSRKGGQVLLRTEDAESAGFVRVAVRDFGVGIKPHDLDKIFTKFGQAGNRRSSGSGLGLTFCKLVVEAHGGTIGVESIPGEGSTFFFTLPVAAA
ncbi:MAG: GAF domain-containing protein [Chloroflexales bacterium]